MKRDWDLIRRILICIELHDTMHSGGDSWTPERSYHVGLLLDAGLIDGLESIPPLAGEFCDYSWSPAPRLTWQGHDFLDAIRDETVWEKTKGQAAKTGGAVTLAVLTQLATYYLMEKLGMKQ